MPGWRLPGQSSVLQAGNALPVCPTDYTTKKSAVSLQWNENVPGTTVRRCEAQPRDRVEAEVWQETMYERRYRQKNYYGGEFASCRW